MAEELVILETAKQLRKKGFNEYCRFVIGEDRVISDIISTWNLPPNSFPVPTQSIAQKWLREVKNLHIEIYRSACGYGYTIVKANNGTWREDDDSKGPNDGGKWDTYEEALEAGIRESLKLI